MIEERYNYELGQKVVVITSKAGSRPGEVVSRRLSTFGKRYVVLFSNGLKGEVMERYIFPSIES